MVQICRRRRTKAKVQTCIAALAIGIVYPTELSHSDWTALEQKMRKVTFQVKIFTEARGGEWVDSNLEGLSAILRRAYESLVHEHDRSIAQTRLALPDHPVFSRRQEKFLDRCRC